MKLWGVALASAIVFASPVRAQATASAGDPAGLVKLLTQAGYSPTLGKDSYGDPEIEFEIADYKATLLFYGCDETTKKGCDSVQLRAGFDREEPWTADKAMAIAKRYRFASVWLDDDGDPWVQWDIVTGDGIPAKVFLDAVEAFGDTVEDAADMVFEKE